MILEVTPFNKYYLNYCQLQVLERTGAYSCLRIIMRHRSM